MLQVKVVKLDDAATIPTRGSDQAAGYDLHSIDSTFIDSGETKLIHTGLSLEIPEGYFGAIYARSGLATKQGLRPANCVGVIDSDYRGEVMVALHNDSEDRRFIEAGIRVAQLVIQKFEEVNFVSAEGLSITRRGEGGFGSTDPNDNKSKKDSEYTWNIY